MSQYDTKPTEYNMNPLERHSTYDQFASLRDTLVFSGKRYIGKAGSILCIGEKEETIEIIWNNLYRESFETMSDANRTEMIIGPYIKSDNNIISNPNFGPLSCVVQKEGWYRLMYKLEVLPTSQQSKVYTYFDIYRPQNTNPITYNIISDKGTAVFDRQASGTLTGTTDDGSCSISFTLGKIFQKMTAFGYIERDLKKGDIVVLRAKDAERGSGMLPNGNDLTLQSNSNYLSIEYLNLPHNN